MTETRGRGRPPKDGRTKRYWDGQLHKLLVDRLTHVEGMVCDGRIDATTLSKSCGTCRYTAYRWMNEDSLSRKGAYALLRVSNGRIAADELTPFILA